METNDEQQIRELIERWAHAIRTGDLPTVMADHDDDIVMFDVPPPYDGVRGIDAYRDSWPGFFEWQAAGATFEIVSLEVRAGDDVAFARALLRCGTEADFRRDPEQRLRLTLGLIKRDGRWIVEHEHHSFSLPIKPDEEARSAAELRHVHRQWFDRTASKDLDGLMEYIADDVTSYEQADRLAHNGIDEVRDVCAQGLETDGVTWEVPDLTVIADGDLAVAWGLDRIETTDADETSTMWSRGTRVFQRRDGDWRMVHQHVSVPFDSATGDARFDLEP